MWACRSEENLRYWSSGTFHLLFDTAFLICLVFSHVWQDNWPRSFQDSACLHFPCQHHWDDRWTQPHMASYMDSGNPNSGPHTCKVNTWPVVWSHLHNPQMSMSLSLFLFVNIALIAINFLLKTSFSCNVKNLVGKLCFHFYLNLGIYYFIPVIFSDLLITVDCIVQSSYAYMFSVISLVVHFCLCFQVPRVVPQSPIVDPFLKWYLPSTRWDIGSDRMPFLLDAGLKCRVNLYHTRSPHWNKSFQELWTCPVAKTASLFSPGMSGVDYGFRNPSPSHEA